MAIYRASLIDNLYMKILEAIQVASDNNLPPYNFVGKHFNVVGWNRYCKDLYKYSREKYLIWHHNGCIRSGVDFINMKQARNDFRKALRYCKENEALIRKENLLSKFKFSNKSKFWKEIGKLNHRCNNPLAYIDGKSNADEILSIFDNKFSSVFKNSGGSCNMNQTGTNIEIFRGPIISLNDTHTAILKINDGIGWDNIHSNHLKFSGPVFKNLINKMFNKFLSHGYLPYNILQGHIKPVIKNKSLGKTNSSNFRPVMNSSNLLKAFEYAIQPILMNHLKLDNRQFGFKSETGCTSALLILKEVINRYVSETQMYIVP